jgi:hypothetical protein
LPAPVHRLLGIGRCAGQEGPTSHHLLQAIENRRQLLALAGGTHQAASPQHRPLPREQLPVGRFRIAAATDRQAQVVVEAVAQPPQHGQLLPLGLDYGRCLDVTADNRGSLPAERFGARVVRLSFVQRSQVAEAARVVRVVFTDSAPPNVQCLAEE